MLGYISVKKHFFEFVLQYSIYNWCEFLVRGDIHESLSADDWEVDNASRLKSDNSNYLMQKNKTLYISKIVINICSGFNKELSIYRFKKYLNVFHKTKKYKQ